MSGLDLLPFCAGAGDVRGYLCQPFAFDGGTCACNGHILIWVPGFLEDVFRGPQETAASIATILAAAKTDEIGPDWIAANSIDLTDIPEQPGCPVCDGSGALHSIECDDCDGDGHFWHGSHTYDCKECDGQGVTTCGAGEGDSKPCDRCYRTGKLAVRVPLNPSLRDGINSHYLKLIQTLPGVQLHQYADGKPIHFKFDGGCGCVMPMTGGQP